MAILIPSKNIYGKQNEKVLDNTISRIEIETTQPTKKKVFAVKAYEDNLEYLTDDQVDERNFSDTDFSGRNVGDIGTTYGFVACKAVCIDYYNEYESFIVPKNNNGQLIEKIRSFDFSINGLKKVYECTGEYTAQGNAYTKGFFDSNILVGEQIDEAGISGSIYEGEIKTSINGETTATKGLTAEVTVKPSNWQILPKTFTEYDTYYLFKNIKLLVKREVYILKSTGDAAGLKGQASQWDATGTYTIFEPTVISLIANGDVITIETADKIIYVPENDKTSKKVFRIEKNELMQSYSNGNGFADFSNTLNAYKNGKEAATIRCSISDYFHSEKVIVENYNETEGGIDCTLNVKTEEKAEFYANKEYIYCDGVMGFVFDYDGSNIYVNFYSKSIIDKMVSGEIEIGYKEISLDNSTKKMAFALYDEVIPMVYGADGKDRPMSTYKDGTPKVFAVLGTKIYYDGAVWQELSLQEI